MMTQCDVIIKYLASRQESYVTIYLGNLVQVTEPFGPQFPDLPKSTLDCLVIKSILSPVMI
jgi:hypothetical protein